ncbi:hypothetical protein Tco_0053781 [Tanacetum coccineum]
MVEEKVNDVSLVNGVFDGAFGGDGEEDFVMGEGVVVSSSSLDRSTKSCLGEIMKLKRSEEDDYEDDEDGKGDDYLFWRNVAELKSG